MSISTDFIYINFIYITNISEGILGIKLLTEMEEQKWEESEKRREEKEERRSEKGKGPEKESKERRRKRAKKLAKLQFIVFFPMAMVCGSEESKVGSLKRQVRSHLAR